MQSCVYITINKISGRPYIGQTMLPIRRSYIGSGKALEDAIGKYGKDGFFNEPLFSFDSQGETDQCEKDLISYLRFIGANPYNIADGGFRGGCGKVSDESKKIRSMAKMGIKLSDAHKKALCIGQKKVPIEVRHELYRKMVATMKRNGTWPSRKGQKWSEETRRRLSKAMTGRKLTQEQIARRIEKNALMRSLGLHHRKKRIKQNEQQ